MNFFARLFGKKQSETKTTPAQSVGDGARKFLDERFGNLEKQVSDLKAILSKQSTLSIESAAPSQPVMMTACDYLVAKGYKPVLRNVLALARPAMHHCKKHRVPVNQRKIPGSGGLVTIYPVDVLDGIFARKKSWYENHAA